MLRAGKFGILQRLSHGNIQHGNQSLFDLGVQADGVKHQQTNKHLVSCMQQQCAEEKWKPECRQLQQ